MSENNEPDFCSSGWDAISEAFEKLYPEQREPYHFGTLISWQLGGNDPLDGISVYDGGDFYHFVTYGLSELYEKESENQEYSGYGFELTVKLKKAGLRDSEAEIRCMAGILQSIARITFQNNEIFSRMNICIPGRQRGWTRPEHQGSLVLSPNSMIR